MSFLVSKNKSCYKVQQQEQGSLSEMEGGVGVGSSRVEAEVTS